MAHVSADRVRDTSTSTGTGAFVVSGTAPTAFRTFSAVLSTSDTFYYAIQHQTASEWEVGLGTYSSTNTITRTTVYASSASGSAVTFSAGTKDVFITLAAARSVQLDNSGNVGIGSAPIGIKLSVASSGLITYFNSSTTDGYIRVDETGGTNNIFGGINGVGFVGTSTNYPFTIRTNNTERMRIDSSGNVGIGNTASTGAKLTVTNNASGGININDSTNNTAVYGNLTIGQFNNGAFIGTIAGSNAASDILRFGTTNTERMRIDSSGNVGIGTSSPGTKLDVSSTGVAIRASGAGETRIFSTNSSSSVTMQLGSETSTGYVGTYSNHPLIVRTNDTERMRVDTSGNVGIGTASPAQKLNVYTGSATNTIVRVNNTVGSIDFGVLSTGESYGGFANSTVYYGTSGASPAVFYTNNSERMRIDSSGNVGIGTSSPSTKLDVSVAGGMARVGGGSGNNLIQSYTGSVGGGIWAGGVTRFYSTGAMTLSTNATIGTGAPTGTVDAVTIDSSGNCLVGTTTNTGSGRLNVTFNGASLNGIVVHSNPSANPSTLMYWVYGGAGVGTVTTNGSTVSYNTTSDYRLKNSVAPMTAGLATVSALKPVTYKWNVDSSNGEGFIAHELAEQIPLAVTGDKDAVDADGNPIHQGVDYSKIVVHLVAAIQELKAQNDELKARVAALENA